ncbi:MAG TPA: endolytic transglycosylase MltG [Blastocatellia bacterium]|nr:endolytic transglycosylase MltG [Blastocatellia bacterium]
MNSQGPQADGTGGGVNPSLPGAPSIKPAPRRRRPLLAAALIILVLIVAAAAGFAVWLSKAVGQPVEHESADRVISIEPGTGTQAIIARLSEAGIVGHPTALKLYLRLTGRAAGLKAGDYKFASPISPLQAIDKIRRGEVYLERVTIPEGYNRFEIAETLAAKTGKASAEEFLRIMDDQTPVANIAPEARDLEGYLFPDTYNYSSKTTAEDLVRAMVNRFEEVFTPEWAKKASQLNRSVHQVVTLASIIEKEAKVPDERPRVASVFHNRLKLRMALGSDPTFIYAAILAGDYDGNPNQPRHRARLSPYNTYQVPGLPPGPIASPGRASLEAALYPEDTDYLYFVVNGTAGRHKFSRTAAEHDMAVQEYRTQQRELRQQQPGGSR